MHGTLSLILIQRGDGERVLGLSAGSLGAAMGLAGLGELLLLLPAGWVSDRIGRLSALLPGLGILALAGVAVRSCLHNQHEIRHDCRCFNDFRATRQGDFGLINPHLEDHSFYVS